MALVHPSVAQPSASGAPGGGGRRPNSVDLAGSAWPVFKLEALAAGLLVCLVLALVVGSAQAAVLAGAAVAAVRWVWGVAAYRSSFAARVSAER